MKIVARVLCLLLACVIFIGSFAGCAAVHRPLSYLKDATLKTVNASVGGEFLSLLKSALESGSISLSYTAGLEAKTDLRAGNGTFYFDREGERFSAVGALTFGDRTFDGNFYLSRNEAVLSSDSLFGSNDFGISFGTLESDLKNSIFRNNSGTAYARPEIGENTAATANHFVKDVFTLFTGLEKDLSLLDKESGRFLDILSQHARCDSYRENGRLYYTVYVDNNSLSRALRDTYTKLRKDKKFCNQLTEIAAARDRLVTAGTGVKVKDWSDRLDYWLMSEAEIDALCAKVDAATPFLFRLNATVRRLTGHAESLSFSFSEQEKEKLSASVSLDKDGNAVLSLRLGNVTRQLSFTVTKDKRRSFEATLLYTRQPDGEEAAIYRGALLLNRKDGAFTLSLSKENETRVFAGTFEKNSHKLALDINQIKLNDEERAGRFSLTISDKADFPAAPEYTNLATVSESRFAAVEPRIKEAHSALRACIEEADFSFVGVCNYFLSVLGVDETIPEKEPDEKPEEKPDEETEEIAGEASGN